VQTAVPTLQDHLAGPIAAGAPAVHGALAVFPLFGPPPLLEYTSFAAGRERGVAIKELADGASVNHLLVFNGGAAPVLLHEGEAVLGAQQNRIFDCSVLVAAGATVRIPVSCVEHGRWDGSRHREAFAPAPQAAYPALRRIKARAAAAGLEAHAAQGAVWREVAEKAERMSAHAPTGAMADIYAGRQDRLGALVPPLQPGQTGALVAIGGAPAILDHVSRADVFADLYEPLVHGYALDALEAADAEPPTLEDAQAFLGRVLTSRLAHHDGIGLGRDVRLAEPGLTGAGLVAGEELVQLTVFGPGR